MSKHILSSRTDTNLDGAAAFSIRVLVGNRSDEMLMLCARQLAQAVLESGCTRYTTVCCFIHALMCQQLHFLQACAAHTYDKQLSPTGDTRNANDVMLCVIPWCCLQAIVVVSWLQGADAAWDTHCHSASDTKSCLVALVH